MAAPASQRSVSAPLATAVLAALGAQSALLVLMASRTAIWPIDAHFYLEKARALLAGEGFATRWAGVDPKYFPGYSLGLALTHLLTNGAPWHWIGLQVGTLWIGALLLVRVARGLGASGNQAWAAGLLWATHPELLRWLAVPMSEPLAAVLALGAIAAYQANLRRPRTWTALLAGGAAGLAISTRAEMAVLAPLLALEWAICRRIPPVRSLIAGAFGLALGCAALIAWLCQVSRAGGEGLTYLRVVQEQALSPILLLLMHQSLIGLTFQPSIPSGLWLCDLWLLALHFALVAAAALALSGRLGRTWALTAGFLLAYVLGHNFWYYYSDRFLVPALPAAALVLAVAGGWWVDGSTARRRTAFALLLVTAAVNAWYGARLANQHALLLAAAQGYDPRQLATHLAILGGGTVITDLGPPLAQMTEARVIFDRGEDLYHRAHIARRQALAAIVSEGVRFIATRAPRAQWLKEARVPLGVQPLFESLPSAGRVTLMRVDPGRVAEALAASGEVSD